MYIRKLAVKSQRGAVYRRPHSPERRPKCVKTLMWVYLGFKLRFKF